MTINRAATASAGGPQTICSGSATVGLGGSVGGGATGGAWTSSGTGAFAPNATTLNATYSPSPEDIEAGAVMLTLSSTGQVPPCGAATAQVLVTINRAATASVGGNQTICAGQSTAGLGGTVGGGATGGAWTSSGGGTFAPDATTLNAMYSPSAADIAAGTVTLTLSSTGQSPPCGAAMAQVVVTINRAATASAGGNQTIISGQSTAGLGGTVGGGATGGAWTSSGTGTFAPNATTLSATYSPSAADIAAGTVTLTLSSTGQVPPCGAATAQVVVTVLVPPSILTQPQSQKAYVGTNASFAVVAQGTAPLQYQWRLQSTPLAGQTNSSLLLTNVQLAQAGDYSVMVTNVAGSIVSSNATLTVTEAPVRTVRLPTTNVNAGASVILPVLFSSLGNENALGFSINFDTSALVFVGASAGASLTNATLNFNTNLVGSGKLGIILALPTSATFNAGTQELAKVTLAALPDVPDISTPVAFGNSPVAKEVSDINGESLAVSFTDGSIAIGGANEADVTPLPNGNGLVTITDWVKIGRYAAGLDTVPSSSQFQRADCAPKSTLGNGAISVSDWVQAGRYAAGLDPLNKAGGPSGPSGYAPMAAKMGVSQLPASDGPRPDGPDGEQDRVVRVVDRVIYPGQTNAVSVELLSQGNEAALGFSLAFDNTVLAFSAASVGSGAPGATLNVNTNQLPAGSLGLALSLPTGNTFLAGTQQVVSVSFVIGTNISGSTAITFVDQPVLREISDVFAYALSAGYSNGLLTAYVEPPKRLQLYPLKSLAQGYFRVGASNADGSGIESQRVSKIELRSTTNLGLRFTNWLTLTNIPVLSNGLLQWDDYTTTNWPLRFYRASESP